DGVFSTAMKRLLLLTVVACSTAHAAPSDDDALALLDTAAAFDPENASFHGLEKWDAKRIDLGPGFQERRRKALTAVVEKLEKKRAAEKDPAIAADLEILIKWTKVHIKTSDLEEKFLVPYFALERLIFGGVRPVLDEQVEQARRQQMVTRLRGY